jgi:hypothetical protein
MLNPFTFCFLPLLLCVALLLGANVWEFVGTLRRERRIRALLVRMIAEHESREARGN